MKRVKTVFAGRVVEFVDRDRALEQITGIAERGTRFPLVIYGPEGCGKTALLRQVKAILEDHGYNVVYTNPMAGRESEMLAYTPSIRDIAREALRLFPDPYSRVVDAAISVASGVMRRLRRPRVAVLMDDIFQAVGPGNAERYVKIEYPPGDYDRVVVLVASSEGVTRDRVGRHSWADLYIMWNMPWEGFRGLYERLPGPKPPFEEAWRLTGGNPRYLEMLYTAGWVAESVLKGLIKGRRLRELVSGLTDTEVETLRLALEDPDVLLEKYREAKSLIDRLVERNLIIEVWDRDERSWIDAPPPEVDRGLGIGRYYAWQTPLHREAVRRALEEFRGGV